VKYETYLSLFIVDLYELSNTPEILLEDVCDGS
jgi:hypothetical protein